MLQIVHIANRKRKVIDGMGFAAVDHASEVRAQLFGDLAQAMFFQASTSSGFR